MGWFLCGLFVGAVIGIMMMGLCAASGREDRRECDGIREELSEGTESVGEDEPDMSDLQDEG